MSQPRPWQFLPNLTTAATGQELHVGQTSAADHVFFAVDLRYKNKNDGYTYRAQFSIGQLDKLTSGGERDATTFLVIVSPLRYDAREQATFNHFISNTQSSISQKRTLSIHKARVLMFGSRHVLFLYFKEEWNNQSLANRTRNYMPNTKGKIPGSRLTTQSYILVC